MALSVDLMRGFDIFLSLDLEAEQRIEGVRSDIDLERCQSRSFNARAQVASLNACRGSCAPKKRGVGVITTTWLFVTPII